MKIKLRHYAEKEFHESSRPCIRTLRTMASRGDIAGAYKDNGGTWWVDLEINKKEHDRIIKLNALAGDDPELCELISNG